jgi:hypothetical protein
VSSLGTYGPLRPPNLLLLLLKKVPEHTLDTLQPEGLLCSPCVVLTVPTFAARCLHVLRDARDPSSERWKVVGEKLTDNFA